MRLSYRLLVGKDMQLDEGKLMLDTLVGDRGVVVVVEDREPVAEGRQLVAGGKEPAVEGRELLVVEGSPLALVDNCIVEDMEPAGGDRQDPEQDKVHSHQL